MPLTGSGQAKRFEASKVWAAEAKQTAVPTHVDKAIARKLTETTHLVFVFHTPLMQVPLVVCTVLHDCRVAVVGTVVGTVV